MTPTDWKTCKLGDVIRLKRGHDLPSQSRLPGNVPVVSSGGPTGTHSTPMANAPGVVIGRYGTIGSVFYVAEDYWPLNTTLYVEDFKGNDARFVYYLLRTVDVEPYSDKGAVPGVNRNHLHEALVMLPPLQEQRAIARTLGALDDKIEVNRQKTKSLEGMARALFKSWFVDFDPVRAKSRDEKPLGLEAAAEALFPNRITDAGIPEGWAVTTIGELVDVRGGSTPSTGEASYWSNGTHAWATPKDMSRLESSVLLDTERRISDDGLARIGSGMLPVGTVLLSSRAPIGYLAIARIPVAVNQGFVAMVCPPDIPSTFILEWTRYNMDAIVARAGGTTFLEISKSGFRPIPVILPPVSVLSAFNQIVGPMYDLVTESERENRTLITLRDGLLPRLIRGEVRVSELAGVGS